MSHQTGPKYTSSPNFLALTTATAVNAASTSHSITADPWMSPVTTWTA